MAAFSGFRPFLTQGNTVNGVQNVFFADGTVGAHYIPSESSVYGASGLTNYGESVVALLDRKGLDDVLGPELVSNTTPNFNIIRDSTQSIVYGPGINLTSGKRYLVELEIESNTGNIGISVRVSNGSGNLSPVASISGLQNGKFVFLVRAITTGSLSLNGDNTGVNLILKTLSVREVVNSLYAQQSSASLRPLLGQAPKAGRRNLLTYSENFDNNVWSKTGTTLESGFTDPNGGINAFRVTATTTNGVLQQLGQSLSSQTAISSLWIKRVSGTGGVRLIYPSGGASLPLALSESWQRFSQVEVNRTGNLFCGVRIDTQGDVVDVAFAQGELGSIATAYQRVGAASDVTESGVTSYPFIRLDLSDDRLETTNVRSTKNLLLATEEFNESVWSKTNITVTTNAIAGPQGDSSADLITENTANGQHRIEQGGVTGDPKVRHEHSIYVKRASGTRAFQVEIQDGLSNAEQWTFDLENGLSKQTYANSFGFAPTIDILADGWYRIKMGSGIANQGTSFRYVLVMASDYATAQNTYTGDGTSGFYIWGAQIELGSQATDYEYGGFSGSVVVAGRNGSEITYNVKSPLGSFTFGPTTYTGGTPGILRATGDIVGYSLIGRTISDVEKYQLIEYYKSRGAKGFLKLGPNLISNGDFSQGLTGWTTTTPNGTFELNNNILRITATQTSPWPTISRDIPYTRGYYHLLKVTVNETFFSGYPPVYLYSTHGGGTGFAIEYIGTGTYSVISFASLSYSAFLRLSLSVSRIAGNPQIGDWAEISNVELYEIRPEEEW